MNNDNCIQIEKRVTDKLKGMGNELAWMVIEQIATIVAVNSADTNPSRFAKLDGMLECFQASMR